MQTFTPTQLHQNPAKLFRAADKDGSVLIKHDRYPDVEFVLSARAKGKDDGSRSPNSFLTPDQARARVRKSLKTKEKNDEKHKEPGE
jgi:hypothetical protein